jgi:hypothetical protein
VYSVVNVSEARLTTSAKRRTTEHAEKEEHTERQKKPIHRKDLLPPYLPEDRYEDPHKIVSFADPRLILFAKEVEASAVHVQNLGREPSNAEGWKSDK